MAKNLVIVESPAKCRTISRYIGKDYDVKATMGHIIDLPEKELGVDIEHDFKPKYTVSKGKSRVVQALKKDASEASTVFLAPDPDREGEAIAWHVANSIEKHNKNIKRIQFNEITKKAVLKAFENPHEIDINKVNAQQARRILDRIVGYKVSPILWRTVFKGLSAGRVQSVALRIICERENEISDFKQKEYWSIVASLDQGKAVFSSKLHKAGGKKIEIPDKDTADAIIEKVKDRPFTIKSVVKSQKKKRPFRPFITSTMQQDASRKLGFSAAKTMMIAQQLYEGLEIGAEGFAGLITYMRTDSTRVSEEALTNAREFVKKEYGGSYLPDSPRFYGKSKNAQDAHEAIRPAQVNPKYAPFNIVKHLNKDQYNLYNLIWRRFISSQMNDAIFESVRIDISVEDYIFRSTGSVMKFDGFLKLYNETRDNNNSGSSEGENDLLPDISEGTILKLKEINGIQHFTQPPPRYSEATLVRELEEKGIGRPSTYAQIIDTLKKRKYANILKKRFVPTEVGFIVKDILVKEFPDVFGVGFTAEMETTLDKVENGTEDWIRVLKDFYRPFNEQLESAKKDIKEIKAKHQERTDRTCPKCNKFPLIVKWGRNGKFLACEGFPACRYTEPLHKEENQQADVKCDKCGAPMVILNINNRRFLGCSKYPECKNTCSLRIGVKCPVESCGGDIVERTSRKGKTFYGCSNHPECNFASWDLPVDKQCSGCGYPIVLYKETKRKGKYYKCPKCKNEEMITDQKSGEDEG